MRVHRGTIKGEDAEMGPAGGAVEPFGTNVETRADGLRHAADRGGGGEIETQGVARGESSILGQAAESVGQNVDDGFSIRRKRLYWRLRSR